MGRFTGKTAVITGGNSGIGLATAKSLVDEGAQVISSVYAATKAALRSFARTLSAELVGRDIRVNAISPGPVETPIYSRMGLSEEALAEAAESLLSRIPLARMGQPAEIAKSVLFLASSESSSMVGTEMVVDGGMSQL